MKHLVKNYILKNNKKVGWIEGFDQTESIFIHIPKAAGTSIAVALYGEDPWHYDIRYYRDHFKVKFDKYTKFAFIRNPFDRLFSSYRYSFIQHKRHSTTSVAFVTKYNTFEDFVLNWVSVENIKNHYFFKPQVDYLCDENGRLIIDFVGRFETLYEDYKIISNILSSSKELIKSNSSGEELIYKNFYSCNMIEIVNSVYYDDLELFNYKFNQS